MPTMSMSAFWGKADIPNTAHQCPLMTQSGRFKGRAFGWESSIPMPETGERRRKPHDDHHRREKIVGNTLGAQPSRATTNVAVTATVAPSGPAMAKGRELRAATKAALMAVVRKVAAMP